MRSKLGKSSISMKEAIIIIIFEECSWFKFNNLGQTLNLESLRQCGKRFKTKCQKFWRDNSYVCSSSMVGGFFLPEYGQS